MVNEAEQIRAEVDGRKQRARDLKIVENVFRLYRERLHYLKGDFSHDQNSTPTIARHGHLCVYAE